MQNKIITHLNFAKGFRGGERQTQLLIEQLSELGFIQRLIVRTNSQLTLRCEKIKNLEIIEISKPYIFHIDKIKGSSILHAHETKALQFAYLAHKVTDIPYIVTRRVDNPIKNNWLNTQMYQKAKIAIGLSNAIEKEILHVSPHAITNIIPSAYTDIAIDNLESKKIKERFKEKFLIGHVGALDEKHKGQSTLIKVAKAIEKTHPNFHFLFLGKGDDEQMLKELAKDLNNITFEGFVNNVNDYINCFDIFVFPSNNEGLGSILFDVMQLRVPIIASNVGGIPDIIKNNENGILVTPKDSSNIEKQILSLYNDDALGKSFAENGLKKINNYSPKNMTNKYVKIYIKINSERD